MPMAGRGSRFSGNGFDRPKPLIEINGKPFFYWAARSIEKFIPCAGMTFVVLEEHVRDFHIDSEIRRYFPEAGLRVLPDVTEGAAITCLRGVEGIPNCAPVLFNDCDHLFKSTEFADFLSSVKRTAPVRDPGPDPAGGRTKAAGAEAPGSGCGLTSGPDGALLTFDSDSPSYSYLEYGADGRVIRTIEKKVVSRDAICGAYYFRSRAVFENACADYLMNCEYKEYFLSGVYNSLIESGGSVRGFRTDFHLPFGIPSEYAEAEKEENLPFFEQLL